MKWIRGLQQGSPVFAHVAPLAISPLPLSRIVTVQPTRRALQVEQFRKRRPNNPVTMVSKPQTKINVVGSSLEDRGRAISPPLRRRFRKAVLISKIIPMNWRNRNLGPWCLGTAQLGSDYGIANVHGHPHFEQALEIVSTAWNAGIVLFDTAASYGNSQQVLGKCFESLGIQDQPLVVTKLSDTDLLSDRCEQLIVDSLKYCR